MDEERILEDIYDDELHIDLYYQKNAITRLFEPEITLEEVEDMMDEYFGGKDE